MTWGNISTNEVYRQFGVDLRGLNLPPPVVQRLVQAGVQTVEFVQSPGGVAAYVNGEPLPAVTWDASALVALGELLPLVDGPDAQVAARVLPLLQFVQSTLVVHFPASQGAAAGGLQGQKERETPTPPTNAVARLEVVYDKSGHPTVVAFDGPAWARWGIRVQPLALPPGRVQRLMEANIQHVRLIVRPKGLSVYVNNRPLPRLVWDEQSLERALQLYLAARGVTDPEVREILVRLVDLMLRAEVDVLFRFPVRPGVTPVPVLEPPHR